jgi:hypothetical protein
MSFASPLAWYWVVVPLAVGVLAILLLLRAIMQLARRRPGAAGAHAVSGTVLLLAAFCAALVVLNTQSFARLVHERAVADVTVAALDPGAGLYRVIVQRLDGSRVTRQCIIQGDEWLLSARVQKWKPWATVLGLDSTYALDQVANKYFTALRGNGMKITACDLSGPKATIMPGLSNWLLARAFVEQRRFGSAVYMPLADGAIYRVTMTQSGLNAEAVNPIAQQAVMHRI